MDRRMTMRQVAELVVTDDAAAGDAEPVTDR
jgi:hypothetical protein